TEQRQSDTANPPQQNNKEDTDDNNTKTNRPPNPFPGQKAEEYLPEQANIEDMPNKKDEEDYEKTIKKNKNK
ncbi:MAG TPA: hypothetical protein VN958_11920, partial [Chitinophagaceae bacterium]|nr:hypothetical protein [Chitinophagaceae bacterium]